jgi:hypothetical protein
LTFRIIANEKKRQNEDMSLGEILIVGRASLILNLKKWRHKIVSRIETDTAKSF